MFEDAHQRRGPRSAGTVPLLAAILLASCAAPHGTGAHETPSPADSPAPIPAATAAAPSPSAPPGAAAVPASTPVRLVSNDGSYLVEFRTRPPTVPLNEPFTLEVRLFDARRGNAPITDAELAVDAGMPEHRHGMNVVPRSWKTNDGTYLVTGMVFHMPGRWELYFDVTRGGTTERTQTELVLE